MNNAKQFAANQVSRASEALARAEREAAHVKAVADYLPDGLPVRFLHGHAYKGKATVICPVKTRADAMALHARFPGVPIAWYRAGCVGHVPLQDSAKEFERATETETDLKPYVWEYDGADYVRGSGESYYWWHDVPGFGLVKFEAEIEERKVFLSPNHVYEREHAGRGTGRVLTYRWRLNGDVPSGGRITNYASGSRETPGKRVMRFEDYGDSDNT